jgi:hypothetical protein
LKISITAFLFVLIVVFAGSAHATTTITACNTYTAADTYVISSTLTSNGSTECLYFHGNAGFSLDCGSNTIPGGTAYSIHVDGVTSAWSINHCPMLKALRVDGSDHGTITNSPSVIVTSPIFHAAFEISSSSYIDYESNGTSNNPTGALQMSSGGDHHTIKNNYIVTGSTNVCAVICFQNGVASNSLIDNNDLIGSWNGSFALPYVGADDGIIYSNATNVTISNNRISKVFDTCIENAGYITNVDVISNTCDEYGTSAYGGWYDSSVQNVRFLGNTANFVNHAGSSPLLFNFSWLTSAYYTGPYYFQNVIISGNKLTVPANTSGKDFLNFRLDYITGASKTLITGGNVFADNILPAQNGYTNNAYILPSGVLNDRGDNICNLTWPSPPNVSTQLSCTSSFSTPVVSYIDPLYIGVLTGSTQKFTTVFNDSSGATDITYAYILVNNTLTSSNACKLLYDRSGNVVYLRNDADSAYVSGTVIPGGGGTLSNSQCTISDAGATTSYQNEIMFPINISFANGFTGGRNVYEYLIGGLGNSGWITTNYLQLGNPIAETLSPINGNDSPQTFTGVFGDTSGYANLTTAQFLINSTNSAYQACYIDYNRSTNTMYLWNDGGTAHLANTVTPGTGGSASNSQCTIENGGAVTGSGNHLTVPVKITFAGGWTGLKYVWTYAANGGASNWTYVGTWIH